VGTHDLPSEYTAEEWAAICDVLRRAALPMRSPSSNQWASIPLRMPVIAVRSASSEGQPRTEEWARLMLERAAREFLDKETAAGELQRQRPNPKEILRTANHLLARLMKAPLDAESKASAHAEFAAQAEAWAEAETWAAAASRRPPRQPGRKTDANRDWLFEALLFVWEECGGETHVSENDERGGPLIQFLQAACDPVFKASSGRPPRLTVGQAREAVRKLLKERGSQDKP
jgi:hypothetical protein